MRLCVYEGGLFSLTSRLWMPLWLDAIIQIQWSLNAQAWLFTFSALWVPLLTDETNCIATVARILATTVTMTVTVASRCGNCPGTQGEGLGFSRFCKLRDLNKLSVTVTVAVTVAVTVTVTVVLLTKHWWFLKCMNFLRWLKYAALIIKLNTTE